MRYIRVRHLTFLDADDEFASTQEGAISDAVTSDDSLGLVIAFAVLSGAFVGVGLIIMRLSRMCREFNEWNSIRFVFPWVAFVSAIECATLSFDHSQNRNDDESDPTDDTRSINRIWAIVVYMLQATVAPGLFLITFSITFLAYRTRSIPFCFVYRGPNPRIDSERTFERHDINNQQQLEAQQLVRPTTLLVALRGIAFGLLVLSVLVNFDVLWNESDLAGRTGWYTIVTEPWDPADTSHIVLSLLPITIVGLACIYFGFLLWRYGTLFSMVIYSSSINPWFTPVLGSILLLGGQWFGPRLFPLMSNIGVWLYMVCLLRLMHELLQEVRETQRIGDFLNAVTSDQIAGHVVVTATNTDVGTAGDIKEVSTKRFGPMDDDDQSNVSSLPSVSVSLDGDDMERTLE